MPRCLRLVVASPVFGSRMRFDRLIGVLFTAISSCCVAFPLPCRSGDRLVGA
jgi:hypothetical protein